MGRDPIWVRWVAKPQSWQTKIQGNVREFQGKCPVMEKSGIEGKVREKSGNLGKSQRIEGQVILKVMEKSWN